MPRLLDASTRQRRTYRLSVRSWGLSPAALNDGDGNDFRYAEFDVVHTKRSICSKKRCSVVHLAIAFGILVRMPPLLTHLGPSSQNSSTPWGPLGRQSLCAGVGCCVARSKSPLCLSQDQSRGRTKSNAVFISTPSGFAIHGHSCGLLQPWLSLRPLKPKDCERGHTARLSPGQGDGRRGTVGKPTPRSMRQCLAPPVPDSRPTPREIGVLQFGTAIWTCFDPTATTSSRWQLFKIWQSIPAASVGPW